MTKLWHITTAISVILLALAYSNSNAGEHAENIYQTYCWQCHGMNGDGKGLNIGDMSVQPRDHTDAKEMSTRTDDDLFRAIKEGGQSVNKSVLMPPWGGTLSDEDIEELVKYLRILCKCQYGKSS